MRALGVTFVAAVGFLQQLICSNRRREGIEIQKQIKRLLGYIKVEVVLLLAHFLTDGPFVTEIN